MSTHQCFVSVYYTVSAQHRAVQPTSSYVCVLPMTNTSIYFTHLMYLNIIDIQRQKFHHTTMYHKIMINKHSLLITNMECLPSMFCFCALYSKWITYGCITFIFICLCVTHDKYINLFYTFDVFKNHNMISGPKSCTWFVK